MNKEEKTIVMTLLFVVGFEWAGLLLLVYFARLPNFISLFVGFIKFLTPWLAFINVLVLFLSFYTKRLKFTLETWKSDLKELFKFFELSFAITIAVVAVAAMLGTLLGISADHLSTLPTINKMREWVNQHFY
jgi:hypothetical protein